MQKGIGIFTKSVKFADFPSAETANSRFGLPPAAAAPPWITFSSHHPSNTGIKTSLAQAASRPRRPSGFAAETQVKNSPRRQNEKNPENWQLVLDKCKTAGIITNVRQANIAGLCNGSTADSDSVCEGSNPSPAAIKSDQNRYTHPKPLRNQGFRRFYTPFFQSVFYRYTRAFRSVRKDLNSILG